jgi:hypothetical protein
MSSRYKFRARARRLQPATGVTAPGLQLLRARLLLEVVDFHETYARAIALPAHDRRVVAGSNS